jgi:hypothetical protein
MRVLLSGVVVCALTFGVGAAGAAAPPVHNAALRGAVANTFQSLKLDINTLESCRGCPAKAKAVYADIAAGKRSLIALPTSGGATYQAYNNALLSLGYYSRFVKAYSDSYTDAEHAYSNSVDYELAAKNLRQARTLATHAAQALSLKAIP